MRSAKREYYHRRPVTMTETRAHERTHEQSHIIANPKQAGPCRGRREARQNLEAGTTG
jgi:hypothetical protein